MSRKVLVLAAALSGVAVALFAEMAPAQEPPLDGAQLFKDNCSACHQAQGQGIPGAFPALAGNPFVLGPKTSVAAVVLKGRGGMPAFSEEMTKAQIAAVVTYVRSSWGNTASAVDLETVERAASGDLAPSHEKSVLPFH